MRKAVRSPIGMPWLATWGLPNQMMATVERFRIRVRAGIMTANSRVTLRVVPVRSSLAASKRCSS